MGDEEGAPVRCCFDCSLLFAAAGGNLTGVLFCDSLVQVAVSDEVPPFTVRHYQQFLDLLLAPDQTLTSILCDTVDSSDADRFVKHLYTVYQAHGKVSTLLTSTITREIQNCSKSALVRAFSRCSTDRRSPRLQLFRTNSPCTKIMTVFARNQGLGYLKQTIQASVRVVAEGSEIFEVDPMRYGLRFLSALFLIPRNSAKPGMDLEANMVTLSRHVESFLESIFASVYFLRRFKQTDKLTCRLVSPLSSDDARGVQYASDGHQGQV